MTRTRRKQGGREGHDEVSPNLDYSTRGLLVTTGQLIYSREQGERSQVKSWREGVYTEYRTLSIYGKGEDGKCHHFYSLVMILDSTQFFELF